MARADRRLRPARPRKTETGSNLSDTTMRNDHVPVRIETERGTIIHRAELEVIDNTQYLNSLRIIFADMVPSKLDNKYVQDPALLQRTRRQAELFGTSVEALTRMGMALSAELSLRPPILTLKLEK